MSEQDYQRGLRGGSCINNDGQHYNDWFAGHLEYERQRKHEDLLEEIEADKYYSSEEQEERRKRRKADRDWELQQHNESYKEQWKRDKENAYKSAEDNISVGSILLCFIYALIFIIIPGFIIRWILGWFNVQFSSFFIWVLAIILEVLLGWESYNNYKKDMKEAERRYGKRD